MCLPLTNSPLSVYGPVEVVASVAQTEMCMVTADKLLQVQTLSLSIQPLIDQYHMDQSYANSDRSSWILNKNVASHKCSHLHICHVKIANP